MASIHLKRNSTPSQAVSLDAVLAASATGTDDVLSTCGLPPQEQQSSLLPSPDLNHEAESQGSTHTNFTIQPWTSSHTPVSPSSDAFDTRSARSDSSASRSTNRLSLTIPIAPPNSLPSRPAPTPSMPPTPSDSAMSSGLSSPGDPVDFIIAIAAQERRVLELREELHRAETELKKLRSHWRANEAPKMRSTRKPELLRDLSRTAQNEGDGSPALRGSLDVDRKKALLLGSGTPKEHKRKVMRGGHARTLSLLSPTKSDSDVAVHHDRDVPHSPDRPRPNPLASPSPAALMKRATWAPRQAQSPHAVKQMAEDFKQGLWTFVEDLRQATVGDEGISATSNRTADFVSQVGKMESDQDTIRASTANRGRIPFDMEIAEAENTPSRRPSGSFHDRAQHKRSVSRPEPRIRKHFSWTPLSFDDVGDDDWSNWDSPASKTSRWSGSTVNGDIITAIPERTDESESTLRRKRSRSELRPSNPQTPARLGELPSTLLNSLTPSNIKRFSTDFMKEWEKSLASPDQDDDDKDHESASFESRLQAINDKSPGAQES